MTKVSSVARGRQQSALIYGLCVMGTRPNPQEDFATHPLEKTDAILLRDSVRASLAGRHVLQGRMSSKKGLDGAAPGAF